MCWRMQASRDCFRQQISQCLNCTQFTWTVQLAHDASWYTHSHSIVQQRNNNLASIKQITEQFEQFHLYPKFINFAA